MLNGADILAMFPDPLDRECLEQVFSQERFARDWLGIDQAPLGYHNFRPRPDRPEQLDEQESFVFNRDPVSFLVGGNAAGTTEAAAAKIAKFCLEQQQPPRRNTPFWILSNTYDQSMGVVWGEKLEGHGHLPTCEVDYDGITWMDRKRNMPFVVPLKPWPTDPSKNWSLEFKSYEQGREAMQARSIGGFCFSEQFELDVFIEVLRGTREYMFLGGQFAEFTPIDPELCFWLEKVMDKPPTGWRFYRANTESNRSNLASGWFEQFFALVPDELRETRMTGALATFENMIYSFNPAVHVVDDDQIKFPPGCEHHNGLDWGASEEHPQAGVWGYRDGRGDWWIYDEYLDRSPGSITRDHALEMVARNLAYGWPEPDGWASMDKKWRRDVVRRVKQLRKDGLRRARGPCEWGECFADPSRPGEMAEFGMLGISILPANNDVWEGINCVRGLLKCHPRTQRPRIHISKRCVKLIEYLRKYRWMRSRKPSEAHLLNPKVAKPMPLKRDDDLPDALRYMVYSVEKNRGMVPSSQKHGEYLKRHGIQLDQASVRGMAEFYRGADRA